MGAAFITFLVALHVCAALHYNNGPNGKVLILNMRLFKIKTYTEVSEAVRGGWSLVN